MLQTHPGCVAGHRGRSAARRGQVQLQEVLRELLQGFRESLDQVIIRCRGDDYILRSVWALFQGPLRYPLRYSLRHSTNANRGVQACSQPTLKPRWQDSGLSNREGTLIPGPFPADMLSQI